jgi:biopolymer transport protein TolR
MTTDGATGSHLQSEINITPMIDVLLVLLIIFMVIVPATSRGEAALMPHPAARTVAPETGAVVLEVLKGSAEEAAFRINQQATSPAELPARLSEIFAKRAQRVLFVKGDDQLSFRQIAEVIDISHAAGVDRVCLLTPRATNL